MFALKNIFWVAGAMISQSPALPWVGHVDVYTRNVFLVTNTYAIKVIFMVMFIHVHVRMIILLFIYIRIYIYHPYVYIFIYLSFFVYLFYIYIYIYIYLFISFCVLNHFLFVYTFNIYRLLSIWVVCSNLRTSYRCSHQRTSSGWRAPWSRSPQHYHDLGMWMCTLGMCFRWRTPTQ